MYCGVPAMMPNRDEFQAQAADLRFELFEIGHGIFKTTDDTDGHC
jgi:hypothetical protein